MVDGGRGIRRKRDEEKRATEGMVREGDRTAVAPLPLLAEGGGYDRNITRVETLIQTMRYIHNNPVRRGLVALPEQWRYSSAAQWEGDSVGPLTIDRDSFPAF